MIDPAEHIGLVRHVLKRYKSITSVEQEDLYSIGLIGLVKAAKSFDPNYGAKFSTYAIPAIKTSIYHYLAENMRYGKVSRRVKAWIIKIGDDGFENHTNEELVKIHEAPLKYVKWARELYDLKMYSMDATTKWKEGEQTTLHDWLFILPDLTQVLVDDFLSQLPPKNRQIIELTMAGYSQTEISRIVGVKQPQVSRIIKKAGEDYRNIG